MRLPCESDSAIPARRRCPRRRHQRPARTPARAELFAAADLLLVAADIVPLDLQRDISASMTWLHGEFAAWLDALPAGEVIAVAGNHDFWAPPIGHGAHHRLIGARWTYLMDAGMTTQTGPLYLRVAMGSSPHGRLGVHGAELVRRRFPG